jgi:hypothetical protein
MNNKYIVFTYNCLTHIIQQIIIQCSADNKRVKHKINIRNTH